MPILNQVATSSLPVVKNLHVEVFGTDSADTLYASPYGFDTTIHAGGGWDTVVGGNGNDTLLGEGGNDTLLGGAGDDTLDGGTGADAMWGGIGNDTYFVDNPRDVVFENPNEGADTVIASVSYTLDANVETLDLAHGAGEINATGNALNNIIFGNESNNVIDGGAGADMTWGGSGADKFVWNSTSEATTNPYGPVDTIMDFDPAEGDKIDLRGLVNEAGGINNVFIFGFEGNGGLTWDFSVSSNTTHQTLALIEVHNTTALHDLQFWNAVIVA